jgi:two-component system NtrC family response regulator
VDVRIIAASNKRLEDQVKKGRLRQDLFYRLNVLSLHIPALRERPEDIPLLLNHFLQQLSIDLGIECSQFDESEVSRLMTYDWPGNVRELKNVVERSLLLNKSPSSCVPGLFGSVDEATEEESESLSLESVEKRHILCVLNQASGNKSAAARILGISRKTLERKARAWGLD